MGCGSSSSAGQSYPRNNYGNQNNYPTNYSNGPVNNPPPPKTYSNPQPQNKPQIVEQRAKKAKSSGIGQAHPINGYHPNEVGVYEKYHDFREYPSENEHNERPYGDPSMLYVDEEFPLHDAIREARSQNLYWKRPGDICPCPLLISEGTTRCDIGQGSAGTCWFLSIIALLSEKEDLFYRILPADEDAYLIDTDMYDGVFHCRFWKFGEWIDVYIDDFLPVRRDEGYGRETFRIWGAHSSTDENEMWVSLMEKAFARFHDGYNEVYGGQPGNAFLALTGGVSEFVDFKKMKMKPKRLHDRIRNSLTTGAIVSCSVPNNEEQRDLKGLIDGHAYSLTGAYVVRDVENSIIPLLRIRNPWGKTEWTGAWSDRSSEWDDLKPGQIDHACADDGEFFMSLMDFLSYFASVTICSVLPDFDRDGCSDSLNFMTGVYGQWIGEKAAGFDNRLLNPRYQLIVTDEGADEDGCVPLVIQIIQFMERRKDDKTILRCDLYKVLSETEDGDLMSLELQGDKTNVYSPEIQVTYRHLLSPGKYVIIPSALDAGVEKEYLIRVFTSFPLQQLDEIPQDVSLMAAESKDEVIVADAVYNLNCRKTLMGAFLFNFNAGGQVSCQDTFDTNPQFAFTVTEPAAVVFTVMQENVEPRCPIGIQLFPLATEPPVDIDYLYEMYDNAIPTTEGQQGKFVNGWDFSAEYFLEPGDYLALVHMNDPTDEKRYSVSVKSSIPIDITHAVVVLILENNSLRTVVSKPASLAS